MKSDLSAIISQHSTMYKCEKTTLISGSWHNNLSFLYGGKMESEKRFLAYFQTSSFGILVYLLFPWKKPNLIFIWSTILHRNAYQLQNWKYARNFLKRFLFLPFICCYLGSVFVCLYILPTYLLACNFCVMIHLGGSNHDERENLQECQIVKNFHNWLREIFSKLSVNDSHEVGEIFSIFSISS